MSLQHPMVLMHPITQDMPLPGNYPCLTLQMNVTMYAGAGTVRTILTVRDPEANIEVWRTSIPTADLTEDVGRAVVAQLMQAMANARYLQTGESTD